MICNSRTNHGNTGNSKPLMLFENSVRVLNVPRSLYTKKLSQGYETASKAYSPYSRKLEPNEISSDVIAKVALFL